ncbi:hypothetical protein GGX14DRAFT_366816 [Mycena pura]|uniref:Uncharacterized protein n=1 Tax=Mycena pura TaxID=153505 RepID=A0AAD6VDT2_9AGAR|nr:hypothetical protein GGX14DRAFT_366816 [Mycena pura]
MHLIPENLIKNLLDLWTGDFKGLDEGSGSYVLQPGTIDAIGATCTAAGDTTPSAFGARVPNLATQRHYYTAESYTLFTTLLGPVSLRGRFADDKYYRHFLDVFDIFNDCTAMGLDRDYVDGAFRDRVIDWVEHYEEYYYQYDSSRYSTCPLTIHALLHIPDDILRTGPMPCYWNYITERFVGFVVRSSKSRKNPYASFARRMREIAQNAAIKVRFHLQDELDLSDAGDEDRNGRLVIGCKCSASCLPLTPQLRRQIENYILRHFDVSPDQVKACIPETVTHSGKVSFRLSGGDKIDGSELVKPSEHNKTRDATFIKYSRQVDANARYRNRPVVWKSQVEYGQLLRLIDFNARLPTIQDGNRIIQRPRSLLLAVVRRVHHKQQYPTLPLPYYDDGKFGPIDIIDVDEISCLVARVPDHGPGPRRFALCERSDTMGVADDDE